MQDELDYAALGLKIKAMRLSKGLTQSDLADMIFCNTSHISNIENNHTKVSLNTLLSIANVLDTSIDHLLTEQYDNHSKALSNDLLRKFCLLSDEKKKMVLRIIDVI